MQNYQFKVYFIDLDGTLLNNNGTNKYISHKNLQAVTKAIKNDVKIVISTGRLGSFVQNFMIQTGIKYAVCGNGSQIIDSQGLVLQQLNIDLMSLNKIREIITKYQLSFKINQKRIAYNVNSKNAKEIAKRLKYDVVKHDQVNWKKEKVYKIILWGLNELELAMIIKEINQNIPEVIATSAERGLTLEITHCKATKAQGNLWILKHIYSINNYDKCCHIGDTMNDASVIKIFNYFIAPCNSEKKLLKIAPYLTTSHHQDCVFEVLNGNFWANS